MTHVPVVVWNSSLGKGRRSSGSHRLLKAGPRAGAIGTAATGHEYGNALRRSLQAERRRVAHLVEGLRSIEGPHRDLAGSAVLPQLEYERTARRRIVAPAINKPGEAQRSGNVGKARIVPNQDQNPIARFR